MLGTCLLLLFVASVEKIFTSVLENVVNFILNCNMLFRVTCHFNLYC